MDTQTTAAGGAARPSLVADVEHLAERVGEGIKDDAEELVDRVFGSGTAATVESEVANVETIVAGVVKEGVDVAGAAVATVTALGAAHLNLGQLSLTAELTSVKASIESGIVALARHLAGIANAS